MDYASRPVTIAAAALYAVECSARQVTARRVTARQQREQPMTTAKSLPFRSLGSSGIETSAIGLGCMSLSGIYGTSGDDDGIALIREALDRGITMLDTSDAYGAGHNEELVGKAIKGRRGGRGAGDQVRQSRRPRRQIRRRPPGICREFLRGEPQAFGRRRDRSLLSAPDRSERADRRHRRRHGQLVEAGQGARARR